MSARAQLDVYERGPFAQAATEPGSGRASGVRRRRWREVARPHSEVPALSSLSPRTLRVLLSRGPQVHSARPPMDGRRHRRVTCSGPSIRAHVWQARRATARGNIVATVAPPGVPMSANPHDPDVLDAGGRIRRPCMRSRALWTSPSVVVLVHSGALGRTRPCYTRPGQLRGQCCSSGAAARRAPGAAFASTPGQPGCLLSDRDGVGNNQPEP
jgi:hypothetical protein